MVFYGLVILSIIVLWFFLAFLFKPIGKIFNKLGKNVKEAMDFNDIIDEEKKESKN